jgi:hypothetical protein
MSFRAKYKSAIFEISERTRYGAPRPKERTYKNFSFCRFDLNLLHSASKYWIDIQIRVSKESVWSIGSFYKWSYFAREILVKSTSGGRRMPNFSSISMPSLIQLAIMSSGGRRNAKLFEYIDAKFNLALWLSPRPTQLAHTPKVDSVHGPLFGSRSLDTPSRYVWSLSHCPPYYVTRREPFHLTRMIFVLIIEGSRQPFPALEFGSII